MKMTIHAICAASAMLLSACNTMEGMGTDIERGGQNLRGAATDVEQDMREDERYK